MLKLNIKKVIIATILLLVGCSIKERIQKPVVKIPREQHCSPNKWDGIPIDTSLEYRRVAESYYVFEPVRKINSLDDEWQLAFVDSRTAILTYDDNNNQVPFQVTLTNETLANFSSGLSVPIDGHIGCFSFHRDKVFFASSPFGKNPGSLTGDCDIFTGDFSRNVISNIEPLPNQINTIYRTWESHPSISPNGKVLFFSSDRVGYKGPDIWFTVLLPNGKWSEPINCGDSVNTECDEITPFVTADGKQLLFSSTGHNNVGGYDLFASNISPEFWEILEHFDPTQSYNFGRYFSGAINLRPPTNTTADEIFPTTPTNPNDLLYYSSNQFAKESSVIYRRGGFDIYCRYKITKPKIAKQKERTEGPMLEIKAPEKLPESPKLAIEPNYNVFGYVYESGSTRKVARANIYVFQLDTLTQTLPDISATPPLISTHSDEQGYYEVSLLKGLDYQIFAESQKFFFDSKRIRLDITDTTRKVRLDFYLPIQFILRINFPLDVYDNPYKFVLDSNGIETNVTWEEELDMLALNIINSSRYIKKIVLVGHTDDIASVEYNYRLGMNRVNFVIEQLVKRGVARELLEGKSSGELEPLPRREGEDLQMYRKRLRRVELQKIF